MKFQNEHEQYVHDIAVQWGGADGDVNAPYGWFSKVDLEPERGGYEEAAFQHYKARHFLVRENSDGVVHVSHYPDDQVDKRDQVFELLTSAHALYEAEISDEDARTAINGYLEAAKFTATNEDGDTLDLPDVTWSAGAQHQARVEVIEFITSNAEDCKEFAERHAGWTQVGIDFSLTRNRHGAGFWDRGVGDLGQRLTEMAHPYGEVTVILGASGELEFL